MKTSSASLVSWRQTTSGRRSSSHGSSRGTRCLTELTFQVATRTVLHGTARPPVALLTTPGVASDCGPLAASGSMGREPGAHRASRRGDDETFLAYVGVGGRGNAAQCAVGNGVRGGLADRRPEPAELAVPGRGDGDRARERCIPGTEV